MQGPCGHLRFESHLESVGSRTWHHAKPERHFLFVLNWHSIPKVHASVAAPASIHQIERFDPDLLGRSLVAQSLFALGLVLAVEESLVDAVLGRNFLFQAVEVLGEQQLGLKT